MKVCYRRSEFPSSCKIQQLVQLPFHGPSQTKKMSKQNDLQAVVHVVCGSLKRFSSSYNGRFLKLINKWTYEREPGLRGGDRAGRMLTRRPEHRPLTGLDHLHPASSHTHSVLLERLIVNRPHLQGLLITFIELIKNPRYAFWSHDFTRCAPDIEVGVRVRVRV